MGKTWYHGTGEGVNFDKFDVNKLSDIANRGKNIYLTENKAAADWFSKLKSQSNYLKTDEFRNGVTSKGIGDFKPNTKEFVIPSDAKIKVLKSLPQQNAEAVIAQLKAQGYDGVRFTDDVLNTIEGQPELAKAFVNGKHPDTTIVFNPDILQPNSAPTPVAQVGKTEAKTLVNKITKLDAVTSMHDILNTGGTVDEALNQYMTKTKSTFGAAQLELNKLIGSGAIEKGKVNASLNPEMGKTLLPTVEKGNTNQAVLNRDFVRSKVQSAGDKALNAVKQLSPNDLALTDELRGSPVSDLVKRAENPKAFTDAANLVKAYNDYTHAIGSGKLEQNVPYRQNYGAPLMFEQTPQEVAAVRKVALKTNPGYSKQRSFQSYNEAAQYGLSRANPSFAHDLAIDVSRRANDLSQLALHKGLNEAFPGQVKVGEIGSTAEGTYKQLQIPGGQKLSLPAKLADEINKRAPAPDAGGLTAKYDSANAFLKYAKLSGGGFHAVTELGNFAGQQLTSGKLFTEPSSTGKIFKTFFSDKALRTEVSKMADSGVLDKARLGGLTWTPSEIKADVNITPHGKIVSYTGIKALHDATFQREIPYAKLKTFEQDTRGLDPSNPADLVKIRATAKGINENYGGINRAVEGLTPKQAKVASRFLLATDFTEGKIRTITAALTKGGPEGKLARQIVAGKALLFATVATTGGLISGEFKDKNPTDVAETILGKFANPTFKVGSVNVGLPSTHISEFGKPLSTFFNGASDKFSGLKTYATNRLAAIPSEVNQLINNQDYSGSHIYGKETKKAGGAPISPAKTAVNVLNGVLPIPASQAISAAQGKQGIVPAVANVAGIRVTPNKTASVLPTTNTSNLTSGQKKAQGTQELAALNAKPPDGYTISPLADGRYAYTLNDGTVQTSKDIKTAQRAVAKSAFEGSDQPSKIIGNVIWRKNADGSATPESLTKYNYSLGSATLVDRKNAGDLSGWMKTAQSQIESIKTQLQDPNIDAKDKLDLNNQATALIKDATKYQSYGGFTKGRGGNGARIALAGIPKIPTVKTRSAPKIKVAKTKTTKFASVKFAKPRRIKVK